jgi:hypothetical protein
MFLNSISVCRLLKFLAINFAIASAVLALAGCSNKSEPAGVHAQAVAEEATPLAENSELDLSLPDPKFEENLLNDTSESAEPEMFDSEELFDEKADDLPVKLSINPDVDPGDNSAELPQAVDSDVGAEVEAQ